MKSNKLFEGLRFGNNEINMIKQNLNDFSMGVEFEFHPNTEISEDHLRERAASEWGSEWDERSLTYFIIDSGGYELDEDSVSRESSVVITSKEDLFDPNSEHSVLVLKQDGNYTMDATVSSRGRVDSLSDLIDINEVDVLSNFLVKIGKYIQYVSEKEIDADLLDDKQSLTKQITDQLLRDFYSKEDDFNSTQDIEVLKTWEELLTTRNGELSILAEELGITEPSDIRELILAIKNNDSDETDTENLVKIIKDLSMSTKFKKLAVDSFIMGIDDSNDLVEDVLKDIDGDRLNEFLFNLPDNIYYSVPYDFEDFYIEIMRDSMDEEEMGRVDINQVIESIPSDIITHIDKVEHEHDNQAEVITKTISVENGIEVITTMFDTMKENGWTTSNKSGMHVSISTNSNKANVNLLKYIVLSNIDYLAGKGDTIKTGGMYPPRAHVHHLGDIIKNEIEDIGRSFIVLNQRFTHENALGYTISRMSEFLQQSKIFVSEKYQSIKLGDYEIHNGRIELRFFGGENYEDDFEKVERLIHRALYILHVSKSDMYEKEYKKALYQIIFNVLDNKLNYTTLIVAYRKLKEKIDSGKIKDQDQLVQATKSLEKKLDSTTYEVLIDVLSDSLPSNI